MPARRASRHTLGVVRVLGTMWIVAACGRVGFDVPSVPSRDAALADASGPRDGGSRPIDGAPVRTDAGVPGPDAAMPADAGFVDPLSAFDRDFTSEDGGWSTIHPEAAGAMTSPEGLRVTPLGTGLWFGDAELYFTFVTLPPARRFVATAVVGNEFPGGPSPPPTGWHLTGLMARDPASDGGPENYVFVAAGAVDGVISRETKSTAIGMTEYTTYPAETLAAEIRICRRDALFELYSRPGPGVPWESLVTYTRGELPDALQVGVFAENDSPSIAHVGIVRSIRFRTLTADADCLAD